MPLGPAGDSLCYGAPGWQGMLSLCGHNMHECVVIPSGTQHILLRCSSIWRDVLVLCALLQPAALVLGQGSRPRNSSACPVPHPGAVPCSPTVQVPSAWLPGTPSPLNSSPTDISWYLGSLSHALEQPPSRARQYVQLEPMTVVSHYMRTAALQLHRIPPALHGRALRQCCRPGLLCTAHGHYACG